jgi:penicillin-binding protein 2
MRHRRLKNPHSEIALFGARSLAAVLVVVLGLLGVSGRFFYLQIMQHETLKARSEANRIKTTALAPARGLIYDRNGVLLADNLPTYRLEVVPEKVSQLSAQLARLEEFISLSEADREKIQQQLRYNRAFKPITVKAKLSEAEVAAFAARKHHFPGFTTVPYLVRYYPYGPLFSHVLGYVGRINENDLKRLDEKTYAGTRYVGKLGIEKFYEKRLHGQPGVLKTEINAQGRLLKVLEETPAQNGEDLTLSLDLRLQQAAAKAFLTNPETGIGAAIALDPRNGEVLAMLSQPGFDPNLFVNGISQSEYRALLNSPDKPLFNRAIKGRYEPGSTIKPYMLLAGLFYGVITPDYRMFSKGYFQLPGQKRKYHDWKRGGHGEIDAVQALAQSVNTFFYDLAVKLGIDRIHAFLGHFGFGQQSGIDVPGEARGLLPSREWKKATRGTIWYPGETVITGIGQGYMIATPIQMARALGILASRGRVNTPQVLKRKQVAAGQLPVSVPEAYWQLVHQGMIEVVNGKKGTARAIASPDYLIAGKTGTSQVYGKKEENIYKKKKDIPRHLRNHALFIAFAPADDPSIAVLVVAEHGASGSKAAAPIAKAIIQRYMELYRPEYLASGQNQTPAHKGQRP